jgi:ppGpp synthetase/RelA/SpoT-type nucleotidyltranferase
LNNLRSWYDEKVPIYKPLVERLRNLVREILDKEAIEYVHIEARLKEFDSFEKKIVRKRYGGPEEVTDLAGVMIVGSVLSNAELISRKIKSGKVFQIDWDKSEDHLIKLAEDRVGYRGKNYVAMFREEAFRNTDEYKKFKDLRFEIQIKTLLDYAWGKIEHDRNYKTAEELLEKGDVHRRFKLAAGALEVVDNEFDRLSKETEQIADPIRNKIAKGDHLILIFKNCLIVNVYKLLLSEIMMRGSNLIITILLISPFQLFQIFASSPEITSLSNNATHSVDSNRTDIMTDNNNPSRFVKVMFNVEPSDSGYINCSNKTILTGSFIEMKNGSVCSATPNTSYGFHSWSQGLGATSSKALQSVSPSTEYLRIFGFYLSDNSSILNITQDGNFTARFTELIELSQEDFFNQYSAISLTFLTGLLVPFLIPWRRRRLQHGEMRKLDALIQARMTAQSSSETDLLRLEELWQRTFLMLSQDKINEIHYKALNDKLSVCYEEICRRIMSALNSIEGLNKLKDRITDAFIKKILDESHYKILNDQILIYEQKIKDKESKI